MVKIMNRSRWKFYIVIFLFPLFTIQFDGCSTNPATGKRDLSLISESQEIQMGKEADQQISASMGLYEDQQLQSYVEGLGKRLAAKSERPNLPWTFRVIDDPVVNAFALPGGYIYITRGILSHMNSEAELVGVLGHEIGHVTAKHSVNQISKQQLTQIGFGVAMIVKPELQQYSQFAELGIGLLFLKFSRDHERQADELGLRYMVKENHDPREMAQVMRTLQAVSKQSGGGGMPEWLSTHPDPANRVDLINQQINEMQIDLSKTVVNREEFLAKLNNMTFGEDPRQGYFVGNTFHHPELQFSFNFPQGWKTINQRQAVFGISPKEDAIIQISLSQQKSPDQAAGAFFGQQGISAANQQQTNINGMPSYRGNFAAQTEQGNLYGDATFIAYGGRVYQILSYTSQQLWNSYNSALNSSVGSFKQVSDQNILNVQPNKLRIVTLDQDMTLQEFYQKYPSVVPVETVAMINQVNTGDRLSKGQRVKQVVK
jgi:predicted Zn-dependent protease